METSQKALVEIIDKNGGGPGVVPPEFTRPTSPQGRKIGNLLSVFKLALGIRKMALSDEIFDIDETFDILISHPGSGDYPAIHVCVKWWSKPPEYGHDDRIICLTADAVDAEEFEMHVDELIEQLEKLKKRGRRKINALKSGTLRAL